MLKKIELHGSHYEIGLKIGALLRKEYGYPPRYSKELLKKARPYEEQVRHHTPDLLDEFRGIADSLGIDYDIPITLETTPYRFQVTSCFTMAISGKHTRSGAPLLARNHEWMEEDSKNLRLCYTKPDGKLSSLGFTFSWPLVSRYGGINEAGLALSSNSAAFTNTGAGIMLNIATRWILDTCKTTREAVSFLERMPKVWGETYILIDAENTIAKVEAHREKTTVTYTDTGFDWNTLLYDSPEMQPFMSTQRINGCAEIKSTRAAFLNEWFLKNKGNISEDLISDVLKSHEQKMCLHGIEGLEICWSYMLNIGDNSASVCMGRPCKNEYVKIEGP